MSLSSNVAAVLQAAAVPMTAREIRKALGDTDSSEVVGNALCDFERRGKVTVIRDQRPYTYVVAEAGNAPAPAPAAVQATAKPKVGKVAPKGNGAAPAPGIIMPPCKLPKALTTAWLRQPEASQNSDCDCARPDCDALQPDINVIDPQAAVSIDRAHLRTLTYLAMRTSAPLDHAECMALVVAARILL